MLNALIAGSALSGACVNRGDQEHGSVGFRHNCGLFFVSRNLAGITGTSGSEARLMVESGDFRVLVEEVERLTEQMVELARVGGREVDQLAGVAVDDELVERYDGEYGI